MRRRLLRAVTLVSVIAGLFVYSRLAFAQFTLPAGAEVDLYFPQIADGGNATQRWQTTLFFVNPNDSSAQGTFWFFGQNGSPMTVQFGTVSGSGFSTTVPAHGSVRFRTTGSASAIRSGWAYANFDKPVQGTAAYRMLVNEVPQQEIAVNAVLPNPLTLNFATAFSGIAIANPWSNVTIGVTVQILDSSGTPLATRRVLLGPVQQTARVLSEWFAVSTSFTGSVSVSSDTALAPAAVLVINSGPEALISSLPPGGVAGFVSEFSAIRTVFYHLLTVLSSDPTLSVGQPTLDTNLATSDPHWPAYASRDGVVHIAPGLVELLRSRDELAHVFAHELGHQWQFTHGGQNFSPNPNPELDADIFGLFVAIGAGYDPYASGGAFGKVMMLYNATSLQFQLWENQYDVHTSFPNRINNLWYAIQQVCSDPRVSSLCQQYKNTFHPLIPVGLLGGGNVQPPKVPALSRVVK